MRFSVRRSHPSFGRVEEALASGASWDFSDPFLFLISWYGAGRPRYDIASQGICSTPFGGLCGWSVWRIPLKCDDPEMEPMWRCVRRRRRRRPCGHANPWTMSCLPTKNYLAREPARALARLLVGLRMEGKGRGAVVVKGGGDDRGTSQGPRRAAKWYVKCSG